MKTKLVLFAPLLAFSSMAASAKQITYKCNLNSNTALDGKEFIIIVKTSFWRSTVTKIDGIDINTFTEKGELPSDFDLTDDSGFAKIVDAKTRKDALTQNYLSYGSNDSFAYDTRFLNLENEAYFLEIDRPSPWCFVTHCRNNYRKFAKCTKM